MVTFVFETQCKVLSLFRKQNTEFNRLGEKFQ